VLGRQVLILLEEIIRNLAQWTDGTAAVAVDHRRFAVFYFRIKKCRLGVIIFYHAHFQSVHGETLSNSRRKKIHILKFVQKSLLGILIASSGDGVATDHLIAVQWFCRYCGHVRWTPLYGLGSARLSHGGGDLR
jgi:hypothetical protein